jgi:hypothetical protein
MALSVCLLTRNDERNIERALTSVAPLGAEMIVADTGSTDQTIALAQKHGARVVPFAWTEDFAAGRNFAVSQATGDWILWLNPDEELGANSGGAVHECMAREEVFGVVVRIHNLVRPDGPDSFTETLDLRLYRRHPGLRYLGRAHPHLVPAPAEIARLEGKSIVAAEIVIRRHGYTSHLDESKLRWSARLLALELQDRPGQLDYLIEYGRTLLQLNDPIGHRVLTEATERILPYVNAPAAPSADVQVLLEYLMTVPPQQSMSRLTAADARALALRWFPRSPALLWTMAAQCFRAKAFEQAARLLEALVACGRTGNYDRSQAFDPCIIGEDAVMNLGACYSQFGDLERAEECYRSLLDSKTRGAAAREQLVRLQNQQREKLDLYFSSLGGAEG